MKKMKLRPGAMPWIQRWTLFWTIILCFGSGLAFLFGSALNIWKIVLSNHRILSLHGISSSFLIFLFGTIVFGHIRIGLNLRKNQLTGLLNVAALAILIVTSWFLYYGAEELRDSAVLIHWVVGCLLIFFIVFHVYGIKRK